MVTEDEEDVSAEGEVEAKPHGWRSEQEVRKVGSSFKRLFNQSIWSSFLLSSCFFK